MVLGKESPTYNLPLPCKFFSIGAARSSLQIKMITNIEILFMTRFDFFAQNQQLYILTIVTT